MNMQHASSVACTYANTDMHECQKGLELSAEAVGAHSFKRNMCQWERCELMQLPHL